MILDHSDSRERYGSARRSFPRGKGVYFLSEIHAFKMTYAIPK